MTAYSACLNDCSAHGTCILDSCLCDAGFYGVDCSVCYGGTGCNTSMALPTIRSMNQTCFPDKGMHSVLITTEGEVPTGFSCAFFIYPTPDSNATYLTEIHYQYNYSAVACRVPSSLPGPSGVALVDPQSPLVLVPEVLFPQLHQFDSEANATNSLTVAYVGKDKSFVG